MAPPVILRFGPFDANLGTGELRRLGKRVALQEQPFRVLVMLLERAGELVTREDLRQRLWPEMVFVDFQHGLNKAVHKLRRALDDTAEAPRFLETLPRRGYRLIASVERLGPCPQPAAFRVLYMDRTIALASGFNLIGRDPEAAVFIDASSVSRRHARIVVEGNAASIEDLGSKNGTFLKERRVAAPANLANGDEIRVGTVRLVFRAVAGVSTKTGSARP